MCARQLNLPKLGVVAPKVLVGDVVVGVELQSVVHERLGIPPVRKLMAREPQTGD
jgi:hypothetical protein